jgi:hypothetical protein
LGLTVRTRTPADKVVTTPIWIVPILALVSLLPLVLVLPALGRLFYFGDDWGLLSDYADLGLGRWLLQPFAENFAPAFKLIWIAAVTAFGGSYVGLILLLWLCHATNVVLLGLLLRRAGLGPVALAAALLAFGLSWTNLESLGWSPQLSQLLSVTFFLVSWVVWDRVETSRIPPRRGVALVLVGLLASGLSFARGVIGGLILAGYGIGEQLIARPRPVRTRLVLAGLASSAIAFAATLRFSTGELNHLGDLGPRGVATAVLYGVSYLALNPLLLLFRLPWQDLGASSLAATPSQALQTGEPGLIFVLLLAIAGAVAGKLAIIGVGLRTAPERSRLILLALLTFDLGNAAILGLGRSQLGLGTAVSSRYQYVSWLAFAPLLGITIQAGYTALVKRSGVESTLPRVVAALGLTALVLIVGLPWPAEAEHWAVWRGDAIRQQYESGAASEQLRYSTITVGRARELGSRFDLR